MESGGRIFNYLDEERKYLGLTALEICFAVGTLLLGFCTNSMIIAIIGCFSSILIIRYIKHLLKISGFKRKIFFIGSDLIKNPRKGRNYYAKYYL